MSDFIASMFVFSYVKSCCLVAAVLFGILTCSVHDWYFHNRRKLVQAADLLEGTPNISCDTFIAVLDRLEHAHLKEGMLLRTIVGVVAFTAMLPSSTASWFAASSAIALLAYIVAMSYLDHVSNPKYQKYTGNELRALVGKKLHAANVA